MMENFFNIHQVSNIWTINNLNNNYNNWIIHCLRCCIPLEDLDCGDGSHGEHLHLDGKIGHPLLCPLLCLQHFSWHSGLEASLRHLGPVEYWSFFGKFSRFSHYSKTWIELLAAVNSQLYIPRHGQSSFLDLCFCPPCLTLSWRMKADWGGRWTSTLHYTSPPGEDEVGRVVECLDWGLWVMDWMTLALDLLRLHCRLGCFNWIDI